MYMLEHNATRPMAVDKVHEKGFVLSLYTIPKSKGFELVEFDQDSNTLKLRTKSPPVKGEANREIEREMKRILNSEVRIISGLKSRRKTLLIPGLTREKVIETLNQKAPCA